MSHVFYDHLVPWEKIDQFLLSHDLSKEERLELIELIEESIHTEILIVICTYLPREKHEEFIEKFHAAPHHEEHLTYLNQHATSDVTKHIHTRSEEVIDEMLAMLEHMN